MTPEERFERIERSIEFMAASQGQHDARLAENAKLIAENSKQVAELTGLALRIGRIVEAQDRRLDDGLTRLTESQLRTDERLNTLINIVEPYFSNGRN